MAISKELQKFAVDELNKLVRIPSISFEGFDRKELDRSGEATADLLRRSGFENVKLSSISNCFPYVTGEFITDPNLPTALVYAHHDVQPPGREELWKSRPFEPTERGGRLYGRGTADDKAGILVHVAALKFFRDSKVKPPVNIRVIIEGEEEVGSDHLMEFLSANRKKLQADVIVVTDTANIDSGVPSITRSLRGLVVAEIEVRSLKAPLHSGMWGGGIVDPVQVLVKMLASLTDDQGKIQLKSLGAVRPHSVDGIPIQREQFAEQAGVLRKESVPENFWHRIWYEPSFSINAIQASSEKLANNVVCDRAYTRIGIRLTSSEKAQEVSTELLKKLKSMAPKTVEVNIKMQEPNDAWETDPHAPKNRWAFEAAEEALQKAFQQPPLYIGCGGSIPFIAAFEQALEAPVITFGVEDPYTLAHSENESLLLSDFFKAIEAEVEFFKILPSKFASRNKS